MRHSGGRWRILPVLLAVMLLTTGVCSAQEEDTMTFRAMLRSRILEILNAWPAEDQYAVMFFIYPNEMYTYGEYENLPEFKMLYKREQDMNHESNPLGISASDEGEERWNPAFWDWDTQGVVIDYGDVDPMTDAFVHWLEATGVQDIGGEEAGSDWDENGVYIGNAPNGTMELVQLAAEIAAELQTSGVIEAKFGRKLPILLSDFEFTWYMVKATHEANPGGEAEAYVQYCIQEELLTEELIR